MAEVIYLVPDPFNPGRLVASATAPLDVDPFNPPGSDREWPAVEFEIVVGAD